jgi:hypothetical protein
MNARQILDIPVMQSDANAELTQAEEEILRLLRKVME